MSRKTMFHVPRRLPMSNKQQGLFFHSSMCTFHCVILSKPGLHSPAYKAHTYADIDPQNVYPTIANSGLPSQITYDMHQASLFFFIDSTGAFYIGLGICEVGCSRANDCSLLYQSEG